MVLINLRKFLDLPSSSAILFYITNTMFKFIHRNGLHWDVYDSDGRAFVIRGDERRVWLDSHSKVDFTPVEFASLESCMAYVCAYYVKSVK